MKTLADIRFRAIYVLFICLAVNALHGHAGAAEVGDVAGKYDVRVGLYIVQQGGKMRIADWGGELTVLAGAKPSGELRIIEGDTKVPLALNMLEAGEEGVRLGFKLSGADGRIELEALASLLPFPVFSATAIANVDIDFQGYFNVAEDGNISGKFEGVGFSFPGQFDSMHFAVEGPQTEAASAGELPAPPEVEAALEEPVMEEPILEEPDLGSIEEATFADEQEEIEGLELADYSQRESLIELAAAKAIADREKSRRASEVLHRKLTGVHTYEFTLNGSEADVSRDAGVNALVASAVRLYSGETVLLGRRILEPYLRATGDKFILTNTILERGVEADGRNRYKARVTIDSDLLYEDLESKHFITRSKFRPIMAVALEESRGGERSFRGQGRSAVEDELLAVDMLVETEAVLDEDAINVDLSSDNALLQQMLDEAQRIDVDAIVTGKLEMTEPESRVILYDELHFVAARLTLSIYRVDNGQLLRTATREVSLARATAEGATEDARRAVARAAMDELEVGFIEEWQAMMLDRSDYRLTVIGIDEPSLERFATKFRDSFPDSRLTVKTHFGSVAVINIDAAQAGTEGMENFIRDWRAPHFEVNAMGRGRFELRTL